MGSRLSQKNTLVIFAKAPRLGLVKSRLAKDIGRVAASAFYRQCLSTTVRRLSGDPRWRVILAVTPDIWANRPEIWPGRVPKVTQGNGDLGCRMQRAMDQIASSRAGKSVYGPLVIIGTDIPDIRATEIATAFKRLGDHDAVFGPSDDGGYWLIGLKRHPRIPRAFKNVRWSTEHALADTQRNLQGLSLAELKCLEDVDDGPAYFRWHQRTLKRRYTDRRSPGLRP